MFLIIGADARLKYTAENLVNSGYKVSVYANDDISLSDGVYAYNDLETAMKENSHIIFGIPVSRDDLKIYSPFSDKNVYIDDVLKNIKPHHVAIGGKMQNLSVSIAKKGALCVDYGTREDFCLYNANITAEALVSIIMDKLPVTVSDIKCLILGYGRIGKALSKKLSDLGAEVTVTARKSSDRAMIDIQGLGYLKTSGFIDSGHSYDVIVNTIPANILREETFSQIKKTCLVIDASAYPGFVNKESAQRWGISVEGAFSLPGKYAPSTAGKIIADVILNICDEIDSK